MEQLENPVLAPHCSLLSGFLTCGVPAPWSSGGHWTAESDSPWLPNELQTKQPIICVHKQLINALNRSNYVYLAVLAKFHAGQLCSAGWNCLLQRLNGGLGFSPVEIYLFKNKIFHYFFLLIEDVLSQMF